MLQKDSIMRVAEVFFISPTKKHYLMEISRELKLAHTSVKKCLNALVVQRLINVEIEKKRLRKFPIYFAERTNRLFKQYKLLYNLSALLASGIIEYIEEKIMPKSIVVFGSYRRGEDWEESDIDLFTESKEEKLDVSIFEKRLKRKVQLHFKENFAAYPKELKNNILNGIVIYGFLEAFK